MNLLSKLTLLAVRLLTACLCRSSLKPRIVFVSYFSTQPQGNLAAVLRWVQQNSDAKVIELFAAFKGGLLSKLKYVWHTLREVYYFNTSAVIVLEGNSFVLSNMRKKPGVTAIQVWHAAGAFKRFGEDTQRLYAIRGLDAVLVSTPEVAPIYAQALNVPEEHVYAVGIPAADVLAQRDFVWQARSEIERKYPALIGRRIALYAPTFRGAGVSDISAPPVDYAALARALPGYALAVRLHPMMTGRVPDGMPDLSGEDLMTALAAADLLITDYSSVIFEYCLFDRPMLFYAPDLARYKGERGFYFGYEQFVPGRICTSLEAVSQAILQEDFAPEQRNAFRKRFIFGCDGQATRRAGELVLRALKKNVDKSIVSV